MSETTGLLPPAKRATLVSMNRTAMIAVAAGLGGCVNVSAPDKPIVINLNINITQEVVYKLDGEAKSLIQNNPGIF
jgi:hypothetical protein